MSAEQAALNKIARERNIVVRENLASIDRYNTVEEAARGKSEWMKRKAEGKLGKAGEDIGAVDQIENGFDRKIQQLQTAGKQASGTIEKQSEDMLSRAQDGFMPGTEEVARFRAAASLAPNGPAAVAQFEQRMSWIRTATTAGAEAVAAKAREMRAAAGPTPTKEQAEDIQFLDDVTAKLRKTTTEDPIGFAERQRLTVVNPIVVDNPDALKAGIAERVATAKALPPQVNPDGKMLKPEDVKAIERKVAMGGEAAVDTVKALVAGAGRDAPKLMRELGGAMPELAQAGLLLSQGGSRQAARDIIAQVVARELPGGQKPVEVDTGTFRKIWVEAIGTSLVYNSQDSQRIEKAARAIAATRLRNVADLKGSDAQAIYEQAIEEAFGGQTVNGQKVGGLGRVKTGWFTSAPVPLPPDVRQGRFPDALAAIRDEDLPGLPVPPVTGTRAAQIRNAWPVPVPGGYRFALGDPAGQDPKFIQGQDGKAFVLPWEAISGKLRERAPGAFVGAP
jgi:hypothetical protein